MATLPFFSLVLFTSLYQIFQSILTTWLVLVSVLVSSHNFFSWPFSSLLLLSLYFVFTAPSSFSFLNNSSVFFLSFLPVYCPSLCLYQSVVLSFVFTSLSYFVFISLSTFLLSLPTYCPFFLIVFSFVFAKLCFYKSFFILFSLPTNFFCLYQPTSLFLVFTNLPPFLLFYQPTSFCLYQPPFLVPLPAYLSFFCLY